MNDKLTSIFNQKGPQRLEIFKQNFLDDTIFEEFIDSCLFDEINLVNCYFDGSEFLGTIFISCSFENCTFKTTTIRKSKFKNCEFKNCQFLNCQLTPKTEFFQTSFRKCRFSIVDLS